MILIEKMIAV